jgi:enamine deaminase RidA (YjgF/YER057c/UK114 family)
MHQAINPDGWPRPKGYSNGMIASGRFLAIAGMIGWDENEKLVGDDFMAQFRKALQNVAAVLEAAGGGPEHLISLTIYVTDKTEYSADLKGVGGIYREVLGKNFPTMALVQVADLLEPGAKVEVQGLAVLPNE